MEKKNWRTESHSQQTFRDDGDHAYLLVLHRFYRALLCRTKRREVDQHVRVCVPLHRVLHVLVYGNEDFLVSPVELLFVVTAASDTHQLNRQISQNAST